MAQGLRRIDPLIFEEHIADNWSKFEKEWRIYCNAGLSDKTKKVQAYTLLYLTAVRPASTLKNTLILAATLFSGARVYYALR